MARSSLSCSVAVAFVCVTCLSGLAKALDLKLDRDDMMITKDAKVARAVYRIADGRDDGAVRIEGDGITVDFQGAELVGCKADQLPDSYVGKGIVIRGRNITLKNAKVRGYKVGILAVECPGLLIEDIDVSGNYQKHLLSTPEAEDGSDWIFGHENDQGQWMTNYGAALYVQRADKIVIRRVRARHGQNGICIDRVNDSKIYDNDCSFLSGWGLAMWRSNRNVISRNAFDFCVRGYSHGVYNRGQDSAGIFMFEQNCNNVIAENSATHGGDCFFGFAGLEALGDKPAPEPGFDYKRRGNNDNLLINNDFSYAPAHGIEMTFSFGNKFIGNRLVGNAICGVWGGYSQDTLIAGNTIENNGEMGYGLERGGINIEHSVNNVIEYNHFKDNRCAIHIWSNPNADFQKKPWGKANPSDAKNNTIAHNTFEGDKLVLHLRNAPNTKLIGNKMVNVGKEMDVDEISKPVVSEGRPQAWQPPKYPVYGETHPVGARKQLYGREHIVMTEWGPYDYTDRVVIPSKVSGGEKATFQVLGPSGTFRVSRVTGNVDVSPRTGELPARIVVSAPKEGLHSFSVQIDADGKPLTVHGTLLRTRWDVKYFQWKPEDDPREHPEKWQALIAGPPADAVQTGSLDLKWGFGAPTPKVKQDHFGTVATTRIKLPAGKYRIWTVSDDGIRVWMDEKRVIDDWTWHPPKENTTTLDLTSGFHTVRIEHFQIDGYAQLQFRIEPVP